MSLAACGGAELPTPAQYVDPFIGTGGHGHTFPGAVMPHGMIQLSPDTRLTGWDACSGYHYSDSTIIGFSHTHLSGTGIGDYGDILMMPTAGCGHITPGDESDTSTGYRSRFSHSGESARPGYYSVMLDDYGIKAELTATIRTGMHRYTFPATDDAAIVVDLGHTLHNQHNTLLSLHVISPTEIEGVKKTAGWAKEHLVCFYARFSKPFEADIYLDGNKVDEKTVSGTNVKARLRFRTAGGEEVMVKTGISAVDTEGARRNLESEIPGWDFDKVSGSALQSWNEALSKIEITGGDVASKRIFYTGLYHALISPNTFVDIDGRYRGQDLQIHNAAEGHYYTVFSLWDTFRALHPLMSIIDPELNQRFAKTLVDKSREGGLLPMWDLASNYTGTMIGYHAVSVVVEAYLKGARNFDPEEAFAACVRSSKYRKFDAGYVDNGINAGAIMPLGILYKDSLGVIPCDADYESVAKALEYAYNDWCIAQFAKALGKDREYTEYMEKAMYYKKYFDPATGFMRGRYADGSWREPFNPSASNHRADDYCEGNAWQWSWFAPHDVEGLIALYGGRERFAARLDSLFTTSSKLEGDAVSSDISGLIGQYAHGNEPSHHITHLYHYVGQSWKTQELVDSILHGLYFDQPDGLSGNEDCGQMSAWYILNSMGLYSVAPASLTYSFSRPLFDRVTVSLGEGKMLSITARNNSRRNKYIQTITVDGKQWNTPFIDYPTLMAGAKIVIVMGDKPNRDFGA